MSSWTSTSPTSKCRCSERQGAGGQHINKTSSAVRYIHHPTGLVASSQEERSQLQNRERAMGRLKSMIAAKAEEDRQAELDAIAGKQAQVGWGSQIRSYVMQPYQMVKDLRTEIETANVSGVLDGDIDFLIEGFLQFKRAQGEDDVVSRWAPCVRHWSRNMRVGCLIACV